MNKYLTIFESHSQYVEPTVKPNVSYCRLENEVHYSPIPMINGHEYVDLGLPSGTLWATCNVGATNPEDFGNYYAWGETSTKESYTSSNYIFGLSPMTKYNDSDNKISLDLEDDAVNVNWGGNWHMPSIELYLELTNDNYITKELITQNGIAGIKFTSKINGNSIFFPSAGYYNNSTILQQLTRGLYWTSNVYVNLRVSAYYQSNSSGGTSINYYNRYRGLTVRGVVGLMNVSAVEEPMK